MLVRASGLHTRDGSQHWSPEEMDFLIALTDELYQEAKRQFPNKTDDELLPMIVTTKKKAEWEKRFNAKFTGTTQPNAKKPRSDRKASALMTQRGRTQYLIDQHKVTADKAWFTKQAAKEEKAKAKAGIKRKRSPSGEEDETAPQAVASEGSEDLDDTVMTAGTSVDEESQGPGDGEEEPRQDENGPADE